MSIRHMQHLLQAQPALVERIMIEAGTVEQAKPIILRIAAENGITLSEADLTAIEAKVEGRLDDGELVEIAGGTGWGDAGIQMWDRARLAVCSVFTLGLGCLIYSFGNNRNAGKPGPVECMTTDDGA